MDCVVVLPTFNEAENITGMLDSVLASELRPRVLVVDDSSPDGTGALVTAYGHDSGDRVALHTRTEKAGLGAAYRDGFARAIATGPDVIVQMDADGSHPVSALVEMARLIADGADLVLGSRYVPGGSVDERWPWYRRAISRGGNLYARAMLGTGLHDLTGGFKMWRAATLAAVDLGSSDAAGYGFQIQTTMAALRIGADVRETPIHFADRTLGESKMHRRIVVEAALSVAALRREHRRSVRRAAVAA